MDNETNVIDVEATTTALARPGGSPPLSMEALANLSESEVTGWLIRAKRAAEAIQQFAVIGIQAYTCNAQWADFNGTAYLMGSGAVALLKLGIEVSEPLFDEVWEGGELFVECCLQATWRAMNLTVTEIGTRSTCDKFWNMGKLPQYMELTKGNERQARLLLRQDVRKAAHENAMSRAVQGLLGLRGLTVAELTEATGIVPQGKVKFKTSGKTDRKTGKTESKTVTVKECLTLAVGSKDLGVRGLVMGVVPKPKHLAVHLEGADGSNLLVKWWTGEDGTATQPDWLQAGLGVFFSDLQIKEYKGARDYQANHAEPVELPETNGKGGDA